MSLINWYAQIICSRKEELQKISFLVVADAYFSKIKFVNPLLYAGFHVISKLRNDAHYAINSQVYTLEKVDYVIMQEKLNLTIWIWTYLQSFNF